MTETPTPPRQELTATPAEIGLLLPGLGRVMVALSAGGATHERIGRVAHVVRKGETLCLGGEAQAASLALPAVRRVVLDRSARMREQVYPRLEFQDARGEVLLRVVGMEGARPFETSFAHLLGPALFPDEPAPAPAPPSTPGEGDCVATTLLRRLHAAGGRVRIALRRGAAEQSWEGVLPEPRLAMGFVNLIEPGFHLHLRQGSVVGLRVSAEGWEALDAAGVPSGLTFMPMEAEARRALEGPG